MLVSLTCPVETERSRKTSSTPMNRSLWIVRVRFAVNKITTSNNGGLFSVNCYEIKCKTRVSTLDVKRSPFLVRSLSNLLKRLPYVSGSLCRT